MRFDSARPRSGRLEGSMHKDKAYVQLSPELRIVRDDSYNWVIEHTVDSWDPFKERKTNTVNKMYYGTLKAALKASAELLLESPGLTAENLASRIESAEETVLAACR